MLVIVMIVGVGKFVTLLWMSGGLYCIGLQGLAQQGNLTTLLYTVFIAI
jgi:hypothetical protein